MARCPSCDDSLGSTVHDGVHLDFCNACGATWASLERLEELHGGPVTVKLLKGETRHRCAECQLTLMRAKLEGRMEVETCTSCRGVFFKDGDVAKFKPVKQVFKTSAKAGTFVCVKCGKDFPKSEGTARGAGLACRPCAGLDKPVGAPGDTPAEAFADWLGRHRAIVVGIAILGLGSMFFIFQAAFDAWLAKLLNPGKMMEAPKGSEQLADPTRLGPPKQCQGP